MTLEQAIRDFFIRYGMQRTYWIAFSGGLDSQVLLSLCQAVRADLPIQLRAIHVHHGLSPKADAWAAHCARVCHENNIQYHEYALILDLKPGESLEKIARDQRYALFADCLNPDDVLLTAHQQDDQAETLLLQLSRGAGPKGLAAMPIMKPFAQGFHGRPLLLFSRQILQQYADQQRLTWLEDESNHNIQLTRNYIRHEVLPVLNHRWPTITHTLARTAAHCAEANQLLEEFAEELLETSQGSRANTLSVNKLRQFSPAKQKLMLRTWITQRGYLVPPASKMQAILQDVLEAAWDATPCVNWLGAILRRYRDDLYLMALPKDLSVPSLQTNMPWQLNEPLILPGIGVLSACWTEGKGLRPDIETVSVRFRQGGESARLPGRGRRTLKHLFQEWHIPPWERQSIPLIFVEEKLIAAVGYFIDGDYGVGQGERGREMQLG